MELISRTLAHRDVQPEHTGVQKSPFLKPSELCVLPVPQCMWQAGLGAAGAPGELAEGLQAPAGKHYQLQLHHRWKAGQVVEEK